MKDPDHLALKRAVFQSASVIYAHQVGALAPLLVDATGLEKSLFDEARDRAMRYAVRQALALYLVTDEILDKGHQNSDTRPLDFPSQHDQWNSASDLATPGERLFQQWKKTLNPHRENRESQKHPESIDEHKPPITRK